MHLRRTKLLELRLLGYVLLTMIGMWMYAMVCWHVPIMSW